jgi:protein-disulfide isomerase
MATLEPAVNAEDLRLGNCNAAITIVEFGDYQCPHCRHAHALIKHLMKDKGTELHFVFRNFPLNESHPYAFTAALAAEAAGKQGKFWEMHGLIYEHQDQLSPAFLLTLAQRLQLNNEQFGLDWQSDAGKNKVERDFESGVRSGVNGTPTFFLNSKPVYTYDGTYESLVDVIQLEVALHGS